MTLNHDEFFYLKEQWIKETGTKFNWYLIHKASRNAVHFHGQCYSPDVRLHTLNRFCFTVLGIESHASGRRRDGP